MHHPTLSTAAVALLAALPAANAGLYPKSSAVLSIDAKNYDSLIAKSNHTSVKLPPRRLACYMLLEIHLS